MAATDLTEAPARDSAPERDLHLQAVRSVAAQHARWLVLPALVAVLQMTNASAATLKLAMAAFAVGAIGWLVSEDVP